MQVKINPNFKESKLKVDKKYMTSRYTDYEFWDECSSMTPGAQWNYGSECYTRKYKCRVPKELLKKAEKSGDFYKIDEWIVNHNEKNIYLN